MAAQSTITVYALNGTNRKFTIPFEYLARRFVTVTLLGTRRTELEITSGFRFLSANQIETTQAWGSAQGYTNIEIRRNTSAKQRLVDFYDGSVLRSRDLNVSAIQTIHIAEEARNMAGETLAENLEGNLDARFRKLVNLGQGTEEFDAVTFGQVQDWSGSALNQAGRALAEANRAQVEQQASTASAARSLASQNAAKVSETNSKTSETNSKTNENSAIAERIRVEAARDVTVAARDTILSIELTANAANTSAIAAKNAAAASQSAAKTSETNAKTSETNAKTSETNSKTSETNSAASRDRAEAAQTAIVNTELTSTANAQSALASKNAAKISETNAKDSENAALQYRNEASNFVPANHLLKASNLSDVEDKAASRTNLGLGTAATKNIGTAIGDVMVLGGSGYTVATGVKVFQRTASDYNGANIALHRGIITLYVTELGTDNYLTATGLKVEGALPLWQVLASRGLSLGASNVMGTQVILGATNDNNVRMYCETREVL